MACDHGMMLMSDHDDAYVDAMLMVNMQANTRSVTSSLFPDNPLQKQTNTKTRGILSDKTLSLDIDFIWILFFVYLIIKFDT